MRTNRGARQWLMTAQESLGRLLRDSRQRYVFGGIAVLSATAAVPLASIVGDSRIDVGLDLAKAPSEVPLLSYGDDAANLQVIGEMERISEEFTPAEFRFELTATGSKDPRAKGSEVWIKNYHRFREAQQDLAGPWKVRRGMLVSAWEQPATVRCKAYDNGEELTLVLRKQSWSGRAILRVPEDEIALDLYSDDPGGTISIPLFASHRPVRYYGQIPRRALASLVLALGNDAPRVQRIYIGSLIPRVYYGPGNTLRDAWGTITENWTADPARRDHVSFPPLSRWETGGFHTFLLLLVLLVLTLSGLAFGTLLLIRWLKWLVVQPMTNRICSSFRISRFLFFFLPCLIVWLFYLACFFPGTMSPDSMSQWRQAHGTVPLDDSHPALHTLTIRLFTLIWDSPAAVGLAQIILMSATLAYGFSLLLRAGISRSLVMGFYLVALLSPKNGISAVVLWKDVLYSVVLSLFTLLLLHFLLDRGAREQRYRWIILGLLLALIPLYRHNGLLVFLAMLLLLPCMFWSLRRYVILAIVVSIGFFVGTKYVLFPILDVKPRESIAYRIHTMHTAIFVDQDVPFAQQEYEFLSNIRVMDRSWKLRPIGRGGPTAGINRTFALRNIDRYTEIYHSLLSRYPLVYLRHRVANLAYLYSIPQPRDHLFQTAYLGITANKSGLEMKPILPGGHNALKGIIQRTTKRPYNWLFWRPALIVFATLVALGAVLVRTRDARLLSVYVPVFLNVLSIAMVSPWQHYRFMLPLTFISGVLVCLAFLPTTSRQTPCGPRE